MEKRYEKNLSAFSKEEINRLHYLKICIVGCGGLGGYIAEEMARAGIGMITLIDGDVFDESNLNRQIVCNEKNIGKKKASETKKRIEQINSEIQITAIDEAADEKNCKEVFRDCQVVFDAVDNIPARILIEKKAEEAGVPLVHGAVNGWYGQVCVIYPGDRIIEKIFSDGAAETVNTKEGDRTGNEGAKAGAPAFTPAAVASVQTAEGIKVLLKKESILRKKLLTMDLMDQEYESIKLDG